MPLINIMADWGMPLFHIPPTGGVASTATRIDASTERVGYVFQAPYSGTLDTIEMLFGAVSMNAASRLRYSFQSLSSGWPDNTADQYRVPTTNPTSSNWFSSVGLMTDDGTDTGVKRSVTKGEWLSFVVEYATFTAADSVDCGAINGTAGSVYGFSAGVGLYTGSWGLASAAGCFVLKYDDGSYWMPVGAFPVTSTATTRTFNSGSNPKERGIKLTPAVPMKIDAIGVRWDIDAAVDIVFYTGTTETDVVTVDVSARFGATAAALQVYRLDTEWILDAGTTYRIVLRPTSVSNIGLADWAVSNASHLTNFCGFGSQGCCYTEKSSSNVWTDTTTLLPALCPLISAIHDGTGGSGGGRRPLARVLGA